MLTWSASCGCLGAWFLQSYSAPFLVVQTISSRDLLVQSFCTNDCTNVCVLFNIELFQIQKITPDHSVFLLTEGSLWNCCTWAQTSCLNKNVLSLAVFFLILFSKLKAFRISLHSSEKLAFTVFPAASWIFLVPELHRNPLSNRMCGLILVLKWDWKRRGCAGGLIPIQQVQ